MWVWILVGVVLLAVIGILFIPMQFYVNTLNHLYFARIGHLAKAYLEGDEKEIIRLRIRFFGLQFFWYPLKLKRSRKRVENPNEKVKKRKPRAQRIFQLIKAFKVYDFEMNVDTGNYVTNAQLYPVFGFFNHHIAKCQINYEGNNSLIIDIRSRPITVLKSFIHY